MAWRVPTASQIAERMAGFLEVALTKAAGLKGIVLDPVKLSFAVRSTRGVFAQLTRAIALELRSVHDHIAYRGRQIFIDQCDDDIVPVHASMWGVDRRAPIKAVGTVMLTGTPAAVIPSGFLLTSSAGISYQTKSACIIGGGGTVTVAAEAVDGGAAANLEAGVRLAIQTVTALVTDAVVASAFVGGTDEQDMASWRDDVRERIRRPPHGGATFDYVTWVKDAADVIAVKVVPGWIGNGSIGLIIAMNDPAGPRAPTAGELATIAAYVDSLRPVTATVVLIPAAIVTINPTVQVRPNTVGVQASVTEAWKRFIRTLGDDEDTGNASPIGATIERSRLIEALSAAEGEYAHDLTVPAATYTLGVTEYPVAGAITFV